MDMNSSSTSNTSAPSALHHNNKQQEGAVMVTSPPSPMEEEVAVAAGKNNVAVKGNKKQAWQQAKARAQQEQGLNCPRCDSSNTKFCYYNNYNLSQPRYFCKACRRYWTRGGTLRNVPVGGGTRKNKHHQQSSSTSKKVTLMSTAAMAATTAAAFPNVVLPTTFMSSFELPTSSLPFAPLSLSNPDGGSGSGTAPSFLDILRGGGLFDGSNGMPAALQFLPPPSFGAGAMNGTPLLHGVEEEVKPPTDDGLLMMEHGGFAAAGPAGGAVQQQEQVVAADARSRSRSNNNNNGGGGHHQQAPAWITTGSELLTNS